MLVKQQALKPVRDLDNFISKHNLHIEGNLKKQDKLYVVEAELAKTIAIKVCHSALKGNIIEQAHETDDSDSSDDEDVTVVRVFGKSTFSLES